jgi:Uma2 family endonuclease
VISPSSAHADRHLKRRRYQTAGIPQYWIVDPDARRIDRWRPGADAPDIVTGPMTWQPVAHGPSLTLDLLALFDDVGASSSFDCLYQ